MKQSLHIKLDDQKHIALKLYAIKKKKSITTVVTELIDNLLTNTKNELDS